jgi:hypothetical protein
MPDGASQFVTKAEAAQVYRRSERSISRDITNALKFKDKRILQHVELRLENGTRRPAAELSIEEVIQLRDDGLNPTWFLESQWLKKHYGRRDERASKPTPPNVVEDVLTDTPPLPDNIDLRAAVLAAQNEALRQSNADLRMQAERLQKELDVRAEEHREETELQKQNNVLMQQVYTMLSSMQESAGKVAVLPAPIRVTEAQTEEPSETEAQSARKGTQPPAKPAASDARVSQPKKRGRNRPSQSAAPKEPKSGASWMSKNLPSIDRTVRSLFRR